MTTTHSKWSLAKFYLLLAGIETMLFVLLFSVAFLTGQIVTDFKDYQARFSENKIAAGLAPLPASNEVPVLVLWYEPEEFSVSILDLRPWFSSGLIQDTAEALEEVSHHSVDLTLTVEHISEFPPLMETEFDFASYLDFFECRIQQPGCGVDIEPDYEKIFADFDICEKGYREVWVWTGPFMAGFPEYRLVGAGMPHTPFMPDCGYTYTFMAFNYERGVGEALHSLGHRTEQTLDLRAGSGRSYQDPYTTQSPWNSWIRACGLVHYPVNHTKSDEPYGYADLTEVFAGCRMWTVENQEPALTPVNCLDWQCTGEGFMRWWLSAIPHGAGTVEHGCLQANFWLYLFWPDSVPVYATCIKEHKQQEVKQQKIQ